MDLFSFDKARIKLNKKEPLRLFETFSGYGSQAMALKRMGVEVNSVGISDWWIPAIIAYGEVHTEVDKELKDKIKTFDKDQIIDILLEFKLSFNDKTIATRLNYEKKNIKELRRILYYNTISKNYGNIENVKGFNVDDVDVFTYSFPCFTGDTLVLTRSGYKKIKDVRVLDEVLTHTNQYKRVTSTYMNGVKDIYKINAMAFHELKTTYNHKFYARKRKRVWNNDKRTYIRTFEQPKWVELKDLTKDDYLGIAINRNSIIPKYEGYKKPYVDGRVRTFDRLKDYMNNGDFWYLIGRYIGDGWVRTQGGIVIGDGKGQISDIINVLKKLEFNYNIAKERTTDKVHIPFQEIGIFVEQFGKGAKNKKLTNMVLDLPIELLERFIEGYIKSDGYVNKNGFISITTISEELVYGIAQCIAKVYKRPYSIYKDIRKPTTVIEGRVVNQNDSYIVKFKKETDIQDKAFYENNYIWFPIHKIEKSGEEQVYDLEVQSNHSFTANGCIVHNCQDLSKAGQQKGLSDETRSGLVYEVLRILNEVKVGGGLMPKVLLMENVPDLLSQKFKDGWHEIYNGIESLGYTSHTFFLNAKDFGVAQNRNRVFMVSIYGDYAYDIPRTKPLVKRLKDYLEDEVDEKFYLSDKTIYNTYTSYVGGYNRKKNFISGVNEKNISKTITTKLDRPESSYIIEPFDKIIDENDLENVGGVVIPEATKQGYAIAKDGDGVYIDRPHQKRGVVQKGMIQTLKTSGNDVGVVVKTHNKDGIVWKTQDNDMPRHRIYNNNKVSFTITTNQSQQPSILESEELKVRSVLRIRKLTPREVLRLMDVSEDDIDSILKVSSNTVAYKLAGNSIVVNVLVEIFKKLF